VLRFFAEDVVWHSAPGWAGKMHFHGHDGVLELIAEWTENFVDYKWVEVDARELHDGRVLVLNRHKGRTRDGVAVDAPLASIYALRGDKIVEVWSYFTWEEALEAVGVESPEVGSSAG
jgi:ketosteroid isomerase-like protein